MKRILLAALLGAAILFIWGGISWMLEEFCGEPADISVNSTPMPVSMPQQSKRPDSDFLKGSATDVFPCPYCGSDLGSADADKCHDCGAEWRERTPGGKRRG